MRIEKVFAIVFTPVYIVVNTPITILVFLLCLFRYHRNLWASWHEAKWYFMMGLTSLYEDNNKQNEL